MSKIKIAFFDAKDYDTASFDEANKDGKFTIKYFFVFNIDVFSLIIKNAKINILISKTLY